MVVLEIATLIVPGFGPAATALDLIMKLCTEMKEGEDTCLRLYERLADLLGELQRMEAANRLPPSDILTRYAHALEKYLTYLEKYRGKGLVSRLIRQKKMLDEMSSLNDDVDALMRMLSLATTGAMMEWKAQWEEDRREQQAKMAVAVTNDAAVLSELRNPREQVEAMTQLKFQMEQRGAEQSKEMIQLMQKMCATIVRTSAASVPSVPSWFLPADEIEYERAPFAQGSFGAVHKGVWGSATKVVVKTLIIDESGMNAATMRMFMDEVNIWSTLHHPHVIKMFGASHVTVPPFIVCEDATANGNLSVFLGATEVNKQFMWRLLHQAAQGLEYLHRKSIVHGDLKLNNILVGSDGLARIADFGLSTVRASSRSTQSRLTSANATEGAPTMSGGLRWRAPECLTKRASFASDVYSLAMCIIEAATNEPPYSFLDDRTVLLLVEAGKLPAQPEQLSDEAWDLVKSMAKVDPSARVSLSDALVTLKLLAEKEQAMAPVSVPVPESLPSSGGVAASDTTRGVHDQPTGYNMAELVQMLRDGSEDLQYEALQALFRRVDADHAQIARSGVVPLLIGIVDSQGETNFRHQLYAARCLQVLHTNGHEADASTDVAACLSALRVPKAAVLETLLSELGDLGSDDDATCLAAIELSTCLALLHPSTQDAMQRAGFVFKLVQRLCHGTEQQRAAAARAVFSLALDNLENQKAIGVSGALPVLVELTRSGADGQKQDAARALRVLASEHAPNRVAIAAAGGTDALVELVRAGTDKQKQHAAYALGNVITGSLANRLSMVGAGGLAPLVELVESGTAKQSENAAFALSILSMSGEVSVAIVDAGAVTRMVALLQAGADKQKEYAARVLANIGSKCGQAIADAGGIPGLVALARTGTAMQKQHAARALGTLCFGQSANHVAVANAGGIFPLVALVATGTPLQKQYAAESLNRLTLVNEANRVAVATAGGVAPLVALVETGTALQKQFAASALSNLVFKDQSIMVMVADAGGIPPLVELVTTGTAKQKENAARALGCIALAPATRAPIADAGGILPLVALLTGADPVNVHSAVAVANLVILAANRPQLVNAGGIRPLVALVESGNEKQKSAAGQALANLAISDSDQAIMNAGGIPALVALLQTGTTDLHKQRAASALAHLAAKDEATRTAIADAGAIAPLVALAQTGTALLKQHAARAVGNLSIDSQAMDLTRVGTAAVAG